MSACAMLSYNNVTPSAWQCGVNLAKNYGVNITSNTGSASSSGFTIAWNYNPGAQTLQIQCTDSPWIVPCSVINSKINSEIESCLSNEKIELTSMVEA